VEVDDRAEFVRVLNGLAAIKRVDLTEDAYELWWHSMRDWPINDFKVAAGYLLKNCQFMPAPNDFEELRKKNRPSAHEAWADALCFADGAWRKDVHEDKRLNAVVDAIGGWPAIALCETAKLGFLERRFIETYNDFSDSDDARLALPDLTERTQNDKALQIGQIVKGITGT